MNFKEIKIGEYIQSRVEEMDISMERICNFLQLDEIAIKEMYLKDSLETEILLRWSKLLEYDFFRIYSQHLILYAAPASVALNENSKKNIKSALPQFKKHVYTREIIFFILELIETQQKTRSQVIAEYKIPKTTLYKWISKYRSGS